MIVYAESFLGKRPFLSKGLAGISRVALFEVGRFRCEVFASLN